MAKAKKVAGHDLQSHPVEVFVVVPLQVKAYKLKMQQSQICMYFITLLLNIKKADESNPGKTSS
ncbi:MULTISPECIES: hypothetical protein [unclassified Microcoleus]|uniref:hypothetical protein n=1 Tax=unclassified Microcoleus TaxID=2642155 RepID=UPI002FD2D4AD